MKDELIDDAKRDDSIIDDVSSPAGSSSNDVGIGTTRPKATRAQQFLASLKKASLPLERFNRNMPLTPSSMAVGLYKMAEDYGIAPQLSQYVPEVTLPSVVKGISDIPVGAAQLASRLDPTGKSQQLTDTLANYLERKYGANYDRAITGEMVGQSIPFMLGGEAPTTLRTGSKLMQLLKGAGSSAAKGAVLSQATPETNLKGNEDFWNRKIQEAKLGALVGGTGGSIVPLLGKKGLNMEVSNLPKEMAETASKTERDTSILDHLISTGDENIAKKAKSIKSNLEYKKGSLPDQMQASVQTRELAEKAYRDLLYKNRNDAAKGVPTPTKDIMASINDGIRLASRSMDKETENYLLGVKQKILSREFKNTFSDMSELRSLIGDEIRAQYGGKKAITGARGAQILQPIKDTISKSMSDAAQKVGGDLAVLDTNANKAHAIYKTKWTDPLAMSLHGNLTPNAAEASFGNLPQDEALGRFAYQGENHGIDLSDRAKKAKELMTSQGVDAAKSMILTGAMKKSKGDPQTFLKEIDQPGAREFFDSQDLAKLEGFKKIMQSSLVAGRASTSAGGLLLGGMLAPHVGLPSVIGEAGGAFAGASGSRVRGVPMPTGLLSKAWSKLFFTDAGQKLLLKANSLPMDSPELKAMAASLNPATQKMKALLGQKEEE